MRLLLTLAWRNLWRHPRRTLLTGLTVAFGQALLLVFLGLNDGGHLQMIEATVRMGSGHVLIEAPGYHRRRGVELALPAPAIERAAAWARTRPELVRAVVPRAFASGLLSSADGATGASLTGVDPRVEASVSRFADRVTRGRFLEASDRAAAVIGAGIARLLKAGVGSRVVLTGQEAGGGEIRSALLSIVGILSTGLPELDESLVLVPLPFLQEFLDLGGGVHQVALLLDDQAAAPAAAAALRAALPDLEVLSWAEANPQLAAFIRIDDAGNYLFDAIFFLLIGFMVLNTLLMSVLERRREFALLDALGLGPRRRFLGVVLEAAILAALASAAGLGLGFAGHTYFRVHGLPLRWFTEQNLEAAGVAIDPIMRSALAPERVAQALAVVFGLTLLLALWAARHAGRPGDPNLLKSR